MDFWLAVWLIVAVWALVQAFLLALLNFEHRRFARSRLRHETPLAVKPRVALFAPCKGLDFELERNLRPLLEQDYGNYEVTFIVESADDPSAPVIRRLLAEYPHVTSRLVVAGLAADTGQKVHNLRVATADLPKDVEVLAFVDSDARPKPNWLAKLTARLARADVGAVTGYRWFVPSEASIGSYLLYSINAAAAAMLSNGGRYLVWGGSWAIRRDTFDRIDLRRRWQGTISDDLIATQVLREHGMRVEFEPNCMLSSATDLKWSQVFEFLRRQYLIGKIHQRPYWMVCTISVICTAMSFWGGIALALAAAVEGAGWWWVPLVYCSVWYAMFALRGKMRYDLARLYVREWSPLLTRACLVDTLAAPLVALVNFVITVSSCFGATIRWRGVAYTLWPNGQIRHMSRLQPESRMRRIDSAAPLARPQVEGASQASVR